MLRFFVILFTTTVNPDSNIMDWWKQEYRNCACGAIVCKYIQIYRGSKSFVAEVWASTLFELFKTCLSRESFRYSNADTDLSVYVSNRANIEISKLADQNFPNYHGNAACKKRKDIASFQIANGEERTHIMCVGARSGWTTGSNPGPLGS